MAKATKTYRATLHKDGRVIESTAKRCGNRWMVGGDMPLAHTELGYKINVYIDGKIYWLKGSVLIFQDYLEKAEG